MLSIRVSDHILVAIDLDGTAVLRSASRSGLFSWDGQRNEYTIGSRRDAQRVPVLSCGGFAASACLDHIVDHQHKSPVHDE